MKTRVLQLVGSFAQGGSERQGVQVTRLLLESGRYEVTLACLDPQGVLRREAEQMGFKEIPEFPLTSFYNANAGRQLSRFVRLLRERKIQIVQTYDFYTNIFGMAGAAIARVPARVAARRETGGVRTRAQTWTELRAFACADVIVANAEAVRKQLISEGVNQRKIVTIYNGMDTKRVAPNQTLNQAAALTAFHLPTAPRRYVTIVANMRHPMKDQATFLRAAQIVYKAVPDAAFVLAGEGELLEPTRAFAASLGLAEETFFIGRCGNISDLLTLSDVCVLSSKGVEGFSNSILEYMAAGRPVVATDVGGAAEAIVDGTTGYVVKTEDHETMANRIISLLQDPRRAREMGEQGRKRVEEKFSCDEQLRLTEQLYGRLLGQPTS